MSRGIGSPIPGPGQAVPSRLYGRLLRPFQGWGAGWDRLGRQAQFYAKTIGAIGYSARHYQDELMRVIAEMAMGAGALILIGGTTVIVGFLTLSAGALVAIQGYNELANVGVEALAGFFATYVNVRIAAPVIAAVGLAATIGAGATARLGAMRINEEIDALEVMGIHTIAFLASSRVIAGVIVVIPLFCVAVLTSFVATQFVVVSYGQSNGVYNHYFNTFLNPTDLMWSFFIVIVAAIVIMLVHTYYGYTASGGPAGVGEAVGRAVRTSLIATVSVTLLVSLAIYGHHGNFHLSE